MRTSQVLTFISLACLICGCTKTVHQRVAGFYPGTVPTTQPVPKTAVYSIRFLDEKGHKTSGIANSHYLLAAGEHAGFDIDEDNGIVAVAGNKCFPIVIPPGYGAIWSATYQKQTQFAREISKAAKTAGRVSGYIAKGIVEGILTDEDDCEWGVTSDDSPGRSAIMKQRERRQHDHWPN